MYSILSTIKEKRKKIYVLQNLKVRRLTLTSLRFIQLENFRPFSSLSGLCLLLKFFNFYFLFVCLRNIVVIFIVGSWYTYITYLNSFFIPFPSLPCSSLYLFVLFPFWKDLTFQISPVFTPLEN